MGLTHKYSTYGLENTKTRGGEGQLNHSTTGGYALSFRLAYFWSSTLVANNLPTTIVVRWRASPILVYDLRALREAGRTFATIFDYPND